MVERGHTDEADSRADESVPAQWRRTQFSFVRSIVNNHRSRFVGDAAQDGKDAGPGCCFAALTDGERRFAYSKSEQYLGWPCARRPVAGVFPPGAAWLPNILSAVDPAKPGQYG